MVFGRSQGTASQNLAPEKDKRKLTDIKYEYPCCMITLECAFEFGSGFLALASRHLASKHGLVNAVAGFYHDHLFIPIDRAQDTMTGLQRVD
jgi:hypothetical protein